jgi:hypothetical protein
LGIFNGDVRGRLVHFCKGPGLCCDSEQQSFDNAYAAGIEGGLFMRFVSQFPSKSRFGSFGISAAAQVAGVLIHDVLGQSLRKAFPDWQSGEVEGIDNDDQDHRKVVQKKLYRSREFLNDVLRFANVALATWVSEQMDVLWLRLEAMDHAGNAIRDASSRRTSPFRATIAQLKTYLVVPGPESPLCALFHHWADLPHIQAMLCNRARAHVLSIIAQLESSCVCIYEDWPYSFVQVAEAVLRKDPTAEEMVEAFYDTPLCCLERSFAHKVD